MGDRIYEFSSLHATIIYQLNSLCLNFQVLSNMDNTLYIDMLFNALVNFLIVVVILKGGISVMIVEYVKKRNKSHQKYLKESNEITGKNVFYDKNRMFSWAYYISKSIDFIKKMTKSIFCRKKYLKECHFENIENNLDIDRKKMPTNWKVNINITDHEFKNYTKNSKLNKKKKSKGSIIEVSILGMIIIFIMFIQISLMPPVDYHIIKYVNNKITNMLTQCNSKFYNEFEIRRFYIDCLPYLMGGHQSSSPYKNSTFEIEGVGLNTGILNIVFFYQMHATYRNITKSTNKRFGKYASNVFGEVDENYDPRDIIEDNEYQMMQFDVYNQSTFRTIPKDSVIYHWDEDLKIMHAMISHHNVTNYSLLTTKLVMDNFINRYLQKLDFEITSYNVHQDLTYHTLLSLEKGKGDSFNLKIEMYGWTPYPRGLIPIIAVLLIFIDLYFIFQ